MRWFTSDTHFGHKNIIKFEAENRPFADTDHMDEALIANWNAVVAPGDLVFHLGDAIMGDFEAGIRKMQRLNGFKILVPGNHDKVFSGEKASRQERFRPAYASVFDTIADEQIELTLDDGTVVDICHFPYEGDHTMTDRYEAQRPANRGRPLLHGHVHGLWRFNGPQFNVGVDVNGLTPVSEDEVIDWVQTL